MINFIASDYDALAPFEVDSAAVRTLKALYIIVITILFLNTLIAILNLRIKRADKNAANLYHLQMASLQVQIELGLLSASERARKDWFPEWFSYTMTETEKRTWKDFLEKNPLKWTEENNFSEDKDHVPQTLVNIDDAPAPAPPTPRASNPDASAATATPTREELPTQQQSTENEQPQTFNATAPIIHDNQPTSDIMAALTPLDPGRLPKPSEIVRDFDLDEEWLNSFADEEGDVEAARIWETGGPERSTSKPNTPKPSKDTQPIVTAAPEPGSEYLEDVEMVDLACVVCGSPGKLCQGCRNVAYCGRIHQKQDWRAHKRACKGKDKA
jgi:hypothetical protein